MGRKRETIIETGKRLFLKQGIADTSMDQIAETVPVSKMTLYNIFGSKEGLLEAVIDTFIREGTDQFDKALEEAADPLDALLRIAAMRELQTEMSAEFLRDLQAFPGLMKKVTETKAAVMPKFEKVILEAQQQGFVRKELSPIVIVSFLQAMGDYLSKSGLLFGMGSPQAVGEQLTSILYHGILAPESSERPGG